MALQPNFVAMLLGARPARDRFQEATRDSLSMRPHRSWTRARGQGVFHYLTRIVVVGACLCANSRAEAQGIRQDLYVTNGLVRAVVVSGNTLYIGGDFNQVGPATGHGVPLDAATGQPFSGFPKVNGSVNAVVPDGSGGWYIGGSFTAVQGAPRKYLAQILSDNSVSAWNPNPDNLV